jgi:hypothetical protein
MGMQQVRGRRGGPALYLRRPAVRLAVGCDRRRGVPSMLAVAVFSTKYIACLFFTGLSMPLRCLLDEESVHSFAFSAEEWSNLKKTYRIRILRMPCCGYAAFPKTSSRGTQFFAHGPNSGCPYVSEPPELLIARIIIAQAVIAAGWEVITEYRERDDSAAFEGWTADVFAHRGRQHIAFQVQWSPGEMDAIRRRQAELATKGIRGAWFYRLYRNRTYSNADLLDEKETPLFGIRITGNEDNFHVPRFDVTLGDFVTGMLNRQLAWAPQPGDEINAGIYVVKTPCWKCKTPIGVPVGIALRTLEGFLHDFLYFHDPGVGRLVCSLLDESLRDEFKIGQIAPRFSKTARQTYLANGCYYCDAIQGESHVRQMAVQLGSLDGLPLPAIQKTIRLDPRLSNRKPAWRFQGDPGRDIY